jgi:hypothetical protein
LGIDIEAFPPPSCRESTRKRQRQYDPGHAQADEKNFHNNISFPFGFGTTSHSIFNLQPARKCLGV